MFRISKSFGLWQASYGYKCTRVSRAHISKGTKGYTHGQDYDWPFNSWHRCSVPSHFSLKLIRTDRPFAIKMIENTKYKRGKASTASTYPFNRKYQNIQHWMSDDVTRRQFRTNYKMTLGTMHLFWKKKKKWTKMRQILVFDQAAL